MDGLRFDTLFILPHRKCPKCKGDMVLQRMAPLGNLHIAHCDQCRISEMTLPKDEGMLKLFYAGEMPAEVYKTILFNRWEVEAERHRQEVK